MKATRVWRYNCEFCGKKKYSKPAMRLHEEHCTMNPNRKCRMCELLNGVGNDLKPMDKLKSIIPAKVVAELTETEENEYYSSLVLNQDESEILAAPYLQKLKDDTDNCPACILATLRQLSIHPRSIGYDYQEEVKKFWIEFNEERREKEEFYPY